MKQLQKINRFTLVESIVFQIQTIIESGQWPVGTRIPAEQELVAVLGVSRNTIREAVRVLVHAGLLTAKQGDGTYVCSSNSLGVVLQRRIMKSTIFETLELRHSLEKQAYQLASIRRTNEDIDAMLFHLHSCDVAAEAKDIHAFSLADIKLHQAIVKATHNDIFIELYHLMTEALEMKVNSPVEMMTHTNFHQNVLRSIVESIIEKNFAKPFEQR
ncbi:FadR/GntR family transcriptional regulator [Brevibacillus sp. NRS-1366]|uniref:FadR/GntR family transcriptional regulator n=1 Tax=Brevibacillus sp. NRS-1366 TaxID=3233899 RepID=UPI003D23BA27